MAEYKAPSGTVDSTENNNSTTGFWIALGVCAAAGAVVAALYATDSYGIRKRITDAIDEAEDVFEGTSDYLKTQATRLAGDAQDAIKKHRSDLDDTYESAQKALTEAYKTAKDKLSSHADDALASAESAAKKARSLV